MTAVVLVRSPLRRATDAVVDVFTSPKSGPVMVTAVLFIAMYLAAGSLYKGFFSGQVFLNLLIDNAYLVVLAVGMTFVILTGGIDLSVGSVVALSTMIAATLLRDGWSPLVVIPLILVATSLLGLAVGYPLAAWLAPNLLALAPVVALLCAVRRPFSIVPRCAQR